jgi:hypothetical protein
VDCRRVMHDDRARESGSSRSSRVRLERSCATRNLIANTSPRNVFQRAHEVDVGYTRRWDITADGIDNRTASILT